MPVPVPVPVPVLGVPVVPEGVGVPTGLRAGLAIILWRMCGCFASLLKEERLFGCGFYAIERGKIWSRWVEI